MSKTNVTIVFDSIYQISGLYITGIILNASTQSSISGVSVNIYGLDQTYVTISDTNGRFYVSTSTVTPGTSYTITADITSDDYQITTTIPTRVIDIPISTNRILISRLANANITTNALITNLASGNVSTHNKINSLISSNSTINQKLTGISYTIGQTNINSNLKVNGDLILSSGNIFDMATAVQITDSMKIENEGTATALIVNQTDTNSANIIDLQDNGVSVFTIGKNGNIINETINNLVLSNVNLTNKIISLESSNVDIHNLLANVQTGSELDGLIEGNITNSTLIGRLTLSNLIVFSELGNISSANTTIFSALNNLKNSNTSVFTLINNLENSNVTLNNLRDNVSNINLIDSTTNIAGNLNINNGYLQINNNSVIDSNQNATLNDISISGNIINTQFQNVTSSITNLQNSNTVVFNSLNVLTTSNSEIYTQLNSLKNGNITTLGTLTSLTVTGTGITGTLNTNSQPNITSVGTLTGLTVSGTGITGTLNNSEQPSITSVGILNGLAVSGTGIVGILATSSQPNVTSVGTLTGLTVSGTGITGTLNTHVQDNITSVGTLTSLVVNTGLNVSSSGNVGIGTDNPDTNYILDVNGSVNIDSGLKLSGKGPFKIDYGTFNTEVITVGNYGTTNDGNVITFNVTFSSSPIVTCTCQSSYGQFTSTNVQDTNISSFKPYTAVMSSSPSGNISYTIGWMAIGY